MGIEYLSRFFDPRSVAVVGASDRKNSVGRTLMENLAQEEFSGEVFPINPNHREVMGMACRKSVTELDDAADLAVIAVPIATVPKIIRECTQSGIKGAIVVSAGGGEAGEEGRKIEEQIKQEAAAGPVRLLGPNCLGFIRPEKHLNASFAKQIPLAGNLAFISQSGAIGTAILDYSIRERFGFSHFISVGAMADLDFADLIDYLGHHPRVESILLYIESLGRIRPFMSAARAISRIKPIVALKSGRTEAGAKAAASHTGAMAGEDTFYDAAFDRAGIVRVEAIGELFDCAELMAKQPRPAGAKLGIVTNAGGAGVMAADALARLGGQPALLGDETLHRLDQELPQYWSRANPIDILGDATPERYLRTVELCTQAAEFDGLLIILTPQAMTDPTGTARELADSLDGKSLPVFAAWMGGSGVAEGFRLLNQADVPTYETPEQAVRAYMYQHTYGLKLEALCEIPPRFPRELTFDRDSAERIVSKQLRENGRLTEAASKELLAAYGIPVTRTETARSPEAAVEQASAIGYPVVMKISSMEVTHKSEAGGVRLDLRTAEEVRRAWEEIMAASQTRETGAQEVTLQPMIDRPDFEILIGAKRDDLFGPLILFGTGGIFTEVLKDVAFALPPLNRLLATRLMQRVQIYTLLKGYRNIPPADLEALEEIILRLSQLVVDFPQIAELDMNPVIVKDGRPVAADARVILKPSSLKSPDHLVISPYPAQYEARAVTSDGLEIFVRPIRPEDAPLFEALFDTLSKSSIYNRFFRPVKSLTRKMLVGYTQIDYDRQIALVALEEDESGRMLGVSRVIRTTGDRKAEFSVMVGDPWQGKGIGAVLLKRCLQVAKDQGVRYVWGTVLPENKQMLALARKLGFDVDYPAQGEVEVRIDLETIKLDQDFGQRHTD
ncbi:MAG: bifunctional acetate--CoA ligase family protein/GNAT family N-acetyltransferase [Desulfobacterales bacterium]